MIERAPRTAVVPVHAGPSWFDAAAGVVLLAALAALPLAAQEPPPAAPVRPEPVEGPPPAGRAGELTRRGAPPVPGEFLGVGAAGEVRWRAAGAEVVEEIPGDEVEHVRFGPVGAPAPGLLWIELVDGDRLWLGAPGGDAERLTGTHPAAAGGALAVPWHRVRALGQAGQEPGAADGGATGAPSASRMAGAAAPGDPDRVELADAQGRRQQIAGEVLQVQDGAVWIETAGGLERLPLAGAGPRFLRATRRARAAPARETPGLYARVTLADGGVLAGRCPPAEAETLTLEHRFLGPLRVPVAEIAALEFHYGGMQWAGALDPVELHAPLALGAGEARWFPAWGLGRDASLDGRPLELAGRGYRKGLAMHAPQRVRYRLDGAFDRFAAVLGVDARAGGPGSVVFEVWVDREDAPRYRSPVLTAADPPLAVTVELAGAVTVELVADSAGDGARGDWACWADARFLVLRPDEERPEGE